MVPKFFYAEYWIQETAGSLVLGDFEFFLAESKNKLILGPVRLFISVFLISALFRGQVF